MIFHQFQTQKLGRKKEKSIDEEKYVVYISRYFRARLYCLHILVLLLRIKILKNFTLLFILLFICLCLLINYLLINNSSSKCSSNKFYGMASWSAICFYLSSVFIRLPWKYKSGSSIKIIFHNFWLHFSFKIYFL